MILQIVNNFRQLLTKSKIRYVSYNDIVLYLPENIVLLSEIQPVGLLKYMAIQRT